MLVVCRLLFGFLCRSSLFVVRCLSLVVLLVFVGCLLLVVGSLSVVGCLLLVVVFF